MYEYEYCWLHIPTGEKGIRKGHYESAVMLLRDVNHWNQQQYGTWQYWVEEFTGKLVEKS